MFNVCAVVIWKGGVGKRERSHDYVLMERCSRLNSCAYQSLQRGIVFSAQSF